MTNQARQKMTVILGECFSHLRELRKRKDLDEADRDELDAYVKAFGAEIRRIGEESRERGRTGHGGEVAR